MNSDSLPHTKTKGNLKRNPSFEEEILSTPIRTGGRRVPVRGYFTKSRSLNKKITDEMESPSSVCAMLISPLVTSGPSTPKRTKARRHPVSPVTPNGTDCGDSHKIMVRRIVNRTNSIDSEITVPSLCGSETSQSCDSWIRNTPTSRTSSVSTPTSHHQHEGEEMRTDCRRVLVPKSMLRHLVLSRSASNMSVVSTLSTKKRVRFVDEDGNTEHQELDDRSMAKPQPSLTEEEQKAAFWTSDEISTMRKKARRFAANYAWKKDKKVVTCLNLLFDSCRANKKDASASTIEHGFEYLYMREIPEDESSATFTTLRGLEGLFESDVTHDRRMECIHAVLRKQAKMQQLKVHEEEDKKNSSKRSDKHSQETIEYVLAKTSAKASSPARRFARFLGKVDEALVSASVDGKKKTRRATIDGMSS